MALEKKIQVTILNTQLDLSTSEPEEKEILAKELNDYLFSLLNKYPGCSHNLILTFACLKIFEEKKQLEETLLKLSEEKDKLNKYIQNALYNIKID